MKQQIHAHPWSLALVTMLSLFLLLAVPVLAEEATSTDSEETAIDDSQSFKERFQKARAEMEAQRAEQKANREERQTELSDQREERSAILEERIQNRISNLATNTKRRMDAAVSRFEQIIDRMGSRMDKLSDRGVDASVALEHLESAEQSVEHAKDTLVTIPEAVEAAITSDKPREGWKSVRELFVGARTDLHEARGFLRLALAALKEAVSDAELGRGVSDAVVDVERDEPSDAEGDTTEEASAADATSE